MTFPTLPTVANASRRLTFAALFTAAGLSGCGGGSGADVAEPAPAPTVLSAADACVALKGTTIAASDLSLPTTGATVTDTSLVAPTGSGSAAVGEYCNVSGSISPVDRSAPPIQFNLALPTDWNGKAMHLMGGGYNGTVVLGRSSTPGSGGLPTPLARGYAAFGSDSGHSGSAVDASFALNDEALENYFGDQLRKTRDVAMKLIERRYGSKPQRTYSAGGSAGGREALYVADRWPTLYEGVIAYYPSVKLTAMLTNYQATSKKLAAPGAWSNPKKQSLLPNAVIAACDAADGATDGIVSHVAACNFDPQTLRCPGGADTGDTCLSDAQVAGLTAYATPLSYPYTLANGTSSYPAFEIFNAGIHPTMGTVAPGNPVTFDMPFFTIFGESFVKYWIYQDPSFAPLQFDLNADGFVQQREKYISARLDINPNLTAFANRGGKVILVHGTTDPLIPTGSSTEFYNRAVAAMGSTNVASFLKYYQVPGYGHGDGAFNVRFDAVAALEQWVEKGNAPSGAVVTDANAANNGRTRPLCEFPTWPKYNGAGDANLASSYTCSR